MIDHLRDELIEAGDYALAVPTDDAAVARLVDLVMSEFGHRDIS